MTLGFTDNHHFINRFDFNIKLKIGIFLGQKMKSDWPLERLRNRIESKFDGFSTIINCRIHPIF